MWSIDRPTPIWVKTPRQINDLKTLLLNKRIAAIDTETTGLNISKDFVVFWSLSTGDDRYFLERPMLEEFKGVLSDPEMTWIGTHTKYDAHMLQNSGYTLGGDFICTLVMDRLLNPDNDHGLKEVFEREFNERMPTFGETFYPRNKSGKPQKPKNMDFYEMLVNSFSQNPEKAIEYASLDAWGSYRVYRRLRDYLKDETTCRGESLWDLYLGFEMPFTRVLYECERRGVAIDVPYLEAIGPKIEEEQGRVMKELAKEAGHMVNPNSPKQLIKLFHEKMDLPVLKKTPTGNPSTDVSVLEQFQEGGVKAAGLVLRYRKIGKIKSTYVDKILDLVSLSPDGRLHGSMNQHVADTARITISDPSMQNFPRPHSDEFKIRQAFIAGRGKKLIVSDYDQLEMFIMAHQSGAQSMIDAIFAGRDLHSSNAAMVWAEPYEEIMEAKGKKENLTERDYYLKLLRDYVKAVGFGQSRPKRNLLKTGEPTDCMSRAIPCCVARRSVSTCRAHRVHSMRYWCPSSWLVMPHSSLTWQAVSLLTEGIVSAYRNVGIATMRQLPTIHCCVKLLYGKAANSLGTDLKFPEKIAEENPDWNTYQIKAESKARAQGLIDKFFRP